VTFGKYKFAYFISLEAIRLGLQLYDRDLKSIVWDIHDALMGFAKIIRKGKLGESVVNSADTSILSEQIFHYLGCLWK
jgi:hypothetical protein